MITVITFIIGFCVGVVFYAYYISLKDEPLNKDQ